MNSNPDAKAIEELFLYKGYPCVVKFHPAGYRCGYVGISEFNRLYDLEKHVMNMKIFCHGGITYDETYLAGDAREGFRWIGFDCNHLGDGCDYDLAKERYGDDEDFEIWMLDNDIMSSKYHSGTNYGTIRTKDYVVSQCINIVDQLVAMERYFNMEAYYDSMQCKCETESGDSQPEVG